nr:hypothetical protein [Alcaligenes faecalis]
MKIWLKAKVPLKFVKFSQEYLLADRLPAFNSQNHNRSISSGFALCLMWSVVLEQENLIAEFDVGSRTGQRNPPFLCSLVIWSVIANRLKTVWIKQDLVILSIWF